MRILITGGTGFIGLHLCKKLLECKSNDILITSRKAQGKKLFGNFHKKRCSFAEINLKNPEILKKVLSLYNPDVVYHLASVRMGGNEGNVMSDLIKANCEGTFVLMQSCAALERQPKVVFASAMGVYPCEDPDNVPVKEDHIINPVDTYGLTKVFGETSCQYMATHYNLKCTILRISGVYGQGKSQGLIYNSLKAAKHEKEIKIPGIGIERDFVYVDDVVQALIQVINIEPESNPVIYNIGGGVGIELSRVIEHAEDITGGKIKVKYGKMCKSSQFYLDIRKAKEDLKYNPRTLAGGMRDLYLKIKNTL